MAVVADRQGESSPVSARMQSVTHLHTQFGSLACTFKRACHWRGDRVEGPAAGVSNTTTHLSAAWAGKHQAGNSCFCIAQCSTNNATVALDDLNAIENQARNLEGGRDGLWSV